MSAPRRVPRVMMGVWREGHDNVTLCFRVRSKQKKTLSDAGEGRGSRTPMSSEKELDWQALNTVVH